MSSRSQRHRRLSFALAAVVASVLTAAACSYDFHAFDPASDTEGGGFDASLDHQGQGDTSPDPQDGGADAGDGATLPTCTEPPLQSCLGDAGACGTNCVKTGDSCRQSCGIINPAECRANCDNGENSCKVGCRSTCTDCTKDAGCPEGDLRRCDDAVNGRDSGG